MHQQKQKMSAGLWLYEAQAELGFFGTNISNLEPEANLFEKIGTRRRKNGGSDKEVEVTLELSDECF